MLCRVRGRRWGSQQSLHTFKRFSSLANKKWRENIWILLRPELGQKAFPLIWLFSTDHNLFPPSLFVWKMFHKETAISNKAFKFGFPCRNYVLLGSTDVWNSLLVLRSFSKKAFEEKCFFLENPMHWKICLHNSWVLKDTWMHKHFHRFQSQ